MNKKEFLELYRISEEDFHKSGCAWKTLMSIKTDYEKRYSSLEKNGKYFAESLREFAKVHSVKMRIKNPDHLVAKIVRIKKDCPKPKITKDNYFDYITDSIGVRVLHLFKEDWQEIHPLILNKWDMKERPRAYYRKGDNIRLFKDKGCDISLHDFGYRSVHYLIKSKPDKKFITVEVQVRTIFEEAWSEIDHIVRYPYEMDNKLLANYLQIFNRLAGNADEMASFVKYLKNEIAKKEKKFYDEINEKNSIIEELKRKISSLEIDSADKEELKKELETLKQKSSLLADDSWMTSELLLCDDKVNVSSVLSPAQTVSLGDHDNLEVSHLTDKMLINTMSNNYIFPDEYKNLSS